MNEEKLERTRHKKLRETANKAVGISIAALTIALTGSSFIPELLSLFIPYMNRGIAIVVAIIIAIFMAILSYRIYERFFDYLFQKSKVMWATENKDMDIGERLYVIQTVLGDDEYLRIGVTDKIIQEFDEYYISHTTHNVRYLKDFHRYEYREDEHAQSTATEEKGTISDTKMSGKYLGDRANGVSVEGLFDAIIIRTENNVTRIEGSFSDVATGNENPRHGQKIYYCNRQTFDDKIKEICRERCEKLGTNVYESYIRANALV